MIKFHTHFPKDQESLCIIGGEEENEKDPLVNLSNQPFFLDGFRISKNLEGMVFKCTLDLDGKGITLELNDPDDEAYFYQFNQKSIFKDLAEQIPRIDIASKTVENDTPESDVCICRRADYPQFFKTGLRP